MNRRKLLQRLIYFVQLAVMAALVCGMIRMAGRYVVYGESQKTAGRSKDKESEGSVSDIIRNTAQDVNVRVRILSQDFEHETHEQVSVASDGPFDVITYEGNEDGEQMQTECLEYETGEIFTVSAENMAEGEKISICPSGKYADMQCLTLASIQRADGCPQYGGELHLYRSQEGIAVVNELPLERYLYCVVSSEIPSYYPLEAQKAQAVCARTYAWNCINNSKNTDNFADLDDSVRFQVYNNYNYSEMSERAVDGTEGEILDAENVLYYSTSCLSEHRDDLQTDRAFSDFLKQEPECKAEYDSPWLRWEVDLPLEQIRENLSGQMSVEGGEVTGIRTVQRSGNGQVQQLEILCGDQVTEVEGEYQIRCVLSPGQTSVKLRDGTTTEGMTMLPSAFFYIDDAAANRSDGEEPCSDAADQEDRGKTTVRLYGGGYGHGSGMSQCGAAAMAEDGMGYREILSCYFDADIVKK